MSLSSELREFLLKEGAVELGFADISDCTFKKGFNSGIVFYLNYKPEVIKSIKNGPTEEYFDYFQKLNNNLDELATKTESFLIKKGFKAYAQTNERINLDLIEDNQSKLPHKTIATKAGLGWIGKSALFVTNSYGSAIRLSSVLTDAPLDYGKPITSSLCGMCTICRDICPGGAISGIPWNSKLKREYFYNHKDCEKTALKLSNENLGLDLRICGQCIYVCPHTQKFIR